MSIKFKKYFTKLSPAFSTVEAMLSLAVFSLIVTAVSGAIIFGEQSTTVSGMRQRATLAAEEGLEATRNMRDADFTLLTDGNHGLQVASNTWSFNAGTTDTVDTIFTRQVQVSTVDVLRKKIISQVTWTQNGQRQGLIVLTTYLSNWSKVIPTIRKGGILVYGDGGTTTDAVVYKTFDSNTSTWSVAAPVADVDASTNRVLRAAKVYASSTRNEKILLSRHFDSAAHMQYIYGQVYDGTTWSHVQLLSSWSANTFLDAQNFDGTYLANGDFMAVYSDFTKTPEFSIWNGGNWGSSISMKAGQSYPNFIVAKARPNTNEVMVAVSGQGKRTETQYYSGAGYATANWTFLQHATNSTANTYRFADFDWSPNDSTQGALVYEANTKYMTAKIFTANGSGGGAWSSAVNSPTQANNAANVSVTGRKTANEFMACNKDNKNPSNLTCYEINSFTPTFTMPTNNILTTGTVTGLQFSMSFAYKVSGLLGLAVYSDNTAAPQIRTYDPGTNTFSANSSAPTLGSVMQSDRVIFAPDTDDAMILMGNNDLSVYSLMFNGTTNTIYTTPAGNALTLQGINGSDTADYWYDFAWDKF